MAPFTASRWPLGVGVALLALVAIAWSVYEAGRQRDDLEAALAAEATLVAGSLGPALAASSAATYELDEALATRLLDNARALAALFDARALDAGTLGELADAAALDGVVIYGASGERALEWGDTPRDLDAEAARIVRNPGGEFVYGARPEEGVDHALAAVVGSRRSVALVRAHTTGARAFAGRLGPRRLLEAIVGRGDVLYLSYAPGSGAPLEASWDEGALPPSMSAPGGLIDLRGRRVFETLVPVEAPAGLDASLRVGLDGAALERAASRALGRGLVVGALLAALGLAAFAAASVQRRRALESAASARRIAEAEAARLRHERLAAAGALTAGLAHEVRSPLNAIGLAAQRIQRQEGEAAACAEFAGRIRDEVGRLEATLDRFLGLARPVQGHRRHVDLRALADQVAALMSPRADDGGVTLEVSGASVAVPVDADALRFGLVNLVNNALDASEPGGRIDVEVAQEGSRARIRVRDTGNGIDPAVSQSLFEPFVTGRADGTGLGLSITRAMAREHGGDLTVENAAGGGVLATLTLPLASRQGDER